METSFEQLPATFPWEDCAEICKAFRSLAGEECSIDSDKGAFRSGDWRLVPPLVFPIGSECISLGDYLQDLPLEPSRQAVVILQAGAAALGLFEGGQELRTKSLKRYVVRGNGRSQSTHLKTKGKSRYGSRLRLQNAKAILEEVNERLVGGLRRPRIRLLQRADSTLGGPLQGQADASIPVGGTRGQRGPHPASPRSPETARLEFLSTEDPVVIGPVGDMVFRLVLGVDS